MRALLFDNLRIDEDAFAALDRETLLFLCPLYKKKNLQLLAKLIAKTHKTISADVEAVAEKAMTGEEPDEQRT